MISFVSLLLGLITGIRTVEVRVAAPVEAVELRLDGREVVTLSGEPWRLAMDFGPELAPHRLVAVARDGEGRELGRVEQWINVPRSPAESRIFVERSPDGTWIARLSWESIVGSEPETVLVELDGEPLEVVDPRRVVLPDLDAGKLHFLRAELRFTDDVTSTAEATFGGQYSDSLRSDLTAVPITVEGGVKPPAAEEMEGWFERPGGPLEVVAVEEGVADIVLVPGPGTTEQLQRMALLPGAARVIPRAGGVRFAMALKKDQRLRVLLPYAEARQGVRQGFDIFPATPELEAKEGGLLWHLTGVRPAAEVLPRVRLTDAVAVAGLLAAEKNRRRAVVLLLAARGPDESRLGTAAVRRYLDRLRVPLVVWGVGEDASGGGWGEVEPVGSLADLERRVRALKRAVDRQRLVWVEGLWLPQEIRLSETARGLRFASVEGRERKTEGDDFDGVEANEVADEVLADEVPPEFPVAARDEVPPEFSAGARGGVGGLVDQLLGPLPERAPSVFDVGREVPPTLRAGRESDLRYRQERLEQARGILGPEPSRLGPWSLLTDVEDAGLLARLARRVSNLEADYRRRYGLEVPVLVLPEVILLFAREKEYRRFESAEAAVAELGLAGHGGGGMAALWVEGRSEEETGSLLIHELTHLLNRRVLGETVPPWLEEGLASDLSLARAGRDGHLELGTLWGRDTVRESRLPLEPGRLRLERAREITGALAALEILREALDAGTPVSVEDLLAFSTEEFLAPGGRPVRYAASAFFVRFLLDGSEERARRFRGFLAAVAAGDPALGERLLATLATDPSRLQEDFESWLREEARRGSRR